MLAQRLPSILPPLTPRELLEVSMIHSVAGALAGGALTDRRPFRAPIIRPRCRRSSGAASTPGPARFRLLTTGSCSRRIAGVPAPGPGQPAPADRDRRSGDRARQPSRRLSGAVPVGRGDEPVPLRHGQRAGVRLQAGAERAVRAQYLGRLSGPLLDRFDLVVDVPAVSAADLMTPPAREGSAEVGGAGRGGAQDPARALRRARARRRCLQRSRSGEPRRGDREAGRVRAHAVARRRRAAAPLGARLPSGAQARAHAGRPRRRRSDPSRPYRRGAFLPRRAGPRRRRGVSLEWTRTHTIAPNSARRIATAA